MREFAGKHLRFRGAPAVRVFADAGRRSHVLRIGLEYRGRRRVDAIIEYPYVFTTSTHAELFGVYHALYLLPAGTRAEVFNDAEHCMRSLSLNSARMSPEIRGWAEHIFWLIESKELQVRFRWIPREMNGAGKLLERLENSHETLVLNGSVRREIPKGTQRLEAVIQACLRRAGR